MRNPFLYGGRVSGDAFCDREREAEELLRDIRTRQHVIVYSQRRLGKTSLVWKVLEEAAKEGVVTVYVDLYAISSMAEFIQEYGKAIARSLSRYERTMRLMRGLFSRLQLTMGVDASGNPQWGVTFDRTMETDSFDEVVSALEGYLERKKKTGVVVFDEFQQIVETDGEKTERRLRSVIQTHNQVCYLFVGSRKHLLSDIFSNPNRPFYRSGKILPLGKISFADLASFIEERFASAQMSVDEAAVRAILHETQCHPYYTQYLCHVLYDIREEGCIEVTDIPRALELLIDREASAYMRTWDALTVRQRQALAALSETASEETPFREATLRKFNMSQPAVMLRALRSLMAKDLVDKDGARYDIVDPFFARWVRTRFVSSATATRSRM